MGLYKMFSRSFFYLTVICSIIGSQAEPRVAIAILSAEPINGAVTFTEVENGILVDGFITGMPEGEYGFHIHELGDVTTCDTTGAHFDLDGNNHGGRDHEVRHNGDFGNVVFKGNENAIANFSFVDDKISFQGRYNIIGRSLVLHKQTDDLGQGGHETSLSTGNAGPRVACGVIGIKSPADGDVWNSALSARPSAILFAIGFFSFIFIKF